MWSPILTDEQTARAEVALRSIAIALAENPLVGIFGPDLATGEAGIAVFFHYLLRARPTWVPHDEADRQLTRSIRRMADVSSNSALYTGFTGISWAATHVQRSQTPALDQTAIDARLVEHVTESPSSANYDLCRGLVGCGLYALERLRQNVGLKLLECVLDRLVGTAVHTDDGATWLTNPTLLPEKYRQLAPDGHFDLGLAHGVPGIIAFLGHVCACSQAPRSTRVLLDAAVSWLLAQRNSDTNSYFEHVLPKGQPDAQRTGSRLAWCYGDLGVSAGLYGAALRVDEPLWAETALEVARRAAARTIEGSSVHDACLCHGSAGVGHIFNRFYQSTEERVFLDAARAWFERTLTMCSDDARFGCFQFWQGREAPEAWGDKPGLLEGTAGIGLALLAAISDVEPEWDRLFLVALDSHGEDAKDNSSKHGPIPFPTG